MAITFDKVVVHHVNKQTSDHAMLVLDTNPQKMRGKRSFFDNR